jgi:uncharacterized protein YfaP (DUF2135 family)
MTSCGHSPSSPTGGSPSGSGALTITATWDVLADVDLHVVEPSGTEIYWANPGPTASGGALDTDADQECKASPGGNKETVQWPSNPPNGTYTVRLDYYDSCRVAATNYTVTISDGKTTLPAITGTLTGPGDVGANGSGVLVKTFTHIGSSFQ